MGAGLAVEKNLVPHGEEALGVFTPQREGGREQRIWFLRLCHVLVV